MPPPERQNLSEILDVHLLGEYSEIGLLKAGRGEGLQDDFIVQEIDVESWAKREVGKASARRKTLGKAVGERRLNLGMSQWELADEVGIDQPAHSRSRSVDARKKRGETRPQGCEPGPSGSV